MLGLLYVKEFPTDNLDVHKHVPRQRIRRWLAPTLHRRCMFSLRTQFHAHSSLGQRLATLANANDESTCYKQGPRTTSSHPQFSKENFSIESETVAMMRWPMDTPHRRASSSPTGKCAMPITEKQRLRMERNRAAAVERLGARKQRGVHLDDVESVQLPTAVNAETIQDAEEGTRKVGLPDSSSQERHARASLAAGSAPPDQKYDYFVVLDFESTCDRDKKVQPQEIIEFSAVLLNARTMDVEFYFQQYVQPTVHPILTAFCTELTGIQQASVNAGKSLQETLLQHDMWLRQCGVHEKQFIYVTWTPWDLMVMLEQERRWRKLDVAPYLRKWIDLKSVYTKLYGKNNLKAAVRKLGLDWYGRAHSGLDDAINTAHVACELMRQGVVLDQTGAFKDGKRKAKDITAYFSETSPRKRSHPSRCYCGKPRVERVTKRPGPNHGRKFFSCGKYSTLSGPSCDYFEWIDG